MLLHKQQIFTAEKLKKETENAGICANFQLCVRCRNPELTWYK